MKKTGRRWVSVLIVTSIIVIAAVSWHSVEEIHYLKTFFPKQFTVEEAFYASGIELIKVFLIAFPLLLVIGAALFLICKPKKDKE